MEKAVEAEGKAGMVEEGAVVAVEPIAAVEDGLEEAVEEVGKAVDVLRVGEDVNAEEQLSNFTTMKLHGGSVSDDGYGHWWPNPLSQVPAEDEGQVVARVVCTTC